VIASAPVTPDRTERSGRHEIIEIARTPVSAPALSLLAKRRVVTSVAALVVLGLAGVVMPTHASAQTSEAASSPRDGRTSTPVWVPNVVRIDRGQEKRERVEEDIAGRLRFVAVPPLAVSEDGSFATEGGRIRIAGIRLPERGRICGGESGRRWTCGVRAHAAFSALVARRRLDCRPVATGGAPAFLYDCRVENRSVAESLVAAGWVELDTATADARLTALGARAEAEKIGIWSSDPPEPGLPHDPRRR
jgi:endonuclease YncB( thermonuclease family)